MAATKLLVMSCKPNDRGQYHHSAYLGRKRIAEVHVDGVISHQEDRDSFRNTPVKFLKNIEDSYPDIMDQTT